MLKQLFAAIKAHNLKKVKEILQEEPGLIDYTNVDEWGPIHICAAYGNSEIMHYLIEQGADPNQQTAYFYTPLHLAIKYHNSACIITLLESGANSTLAANGGADAVSYLNQYYPELHLDVIIEQDDALHLEVSDGHLRIIGEHTNYAMEAF